MQTCSAKRTEAGKFGYFRFLFRQNWPAVVTNTIVLILVNVLILSMILTDVTDGYSATHILRADIQNVARILRVINTIVASLLAVLWGSTAMSYVNSKVSVNFYHSLPVTRYGLYLSEAAVKLAAFAIPSFIGITLASVTTTIMSGIWDLHTCLIYLSAFGMSVLYFLFYLSIMFLAASFTGTVFARLMSAGILVFMPAGLVLCSALLLGYNAVYSDYSALSEFALKIFAPARTVVFAISTEELTGFWTDVSSYTSYTVREILITVLLTAVFFGLGAVIYKRRKSEWSGTPVLSKHAAGVIKYTCMFCAAVLIGYMFDLFMDNPFWYLLWGLVGAFLVLLFLNVIFTKSAKKMLSGLPAFGVFCGLFAAVFILFGVDVVGHDRYVPALCYDMEITLSGTGGLCVAMETAEETEQARDLLTALIREDAEGTANSYPTAEYYATWSEDQSDFERAVEDAKTSLAYREDMVRIRFQYKTALGITAQKSMRVSSDSARDLIRFLTEAENFPDAYFGRLENLSDPEKLTKDVSVTTTDLFGRVIKEERLSPLEIVEIEKRMRAEYTGQSYFQRTARAKIMFEGYGRDLSYYYYFYPDFTSDVPESSFAGSVTHAIVLDTVSGTYKEYDSPEDIVRICENIVIQDGNSDCHYTFRDSSYRVALIMTDSTGYATYYIGAFLLDHVPDFVK